MRRLIAPHLSFFSYRLQLFHLARPLTGGVRRPAGRAGFIHQGLQVGAFFFQHGVDLFAIETCQDTLNVKAGLSGIEGSSERGGSGSSPWTGSSAISSSSVTSPT